MSVASNDACASENKAIGITNRQDITGFGTFTMLIDDTLATFFGNGMRPIKVQMVTIKLILDQMDALLPDLFKATRSTPFLPVIVNCLPTDFFFSMAAK